MNTQTFSLDQLIPVTDFRRHTGEFIKNIPENGYILTKDGQPVARITAIEKPITDKEVKKNLEKLQKLAGGFSLARHMSPEELNREYDKMYDEMLPRQ